MSRAKTRVVQSVEIPPLARAAYLHFNEVLDFIWKSPDFIEHQRHLEERSFAASANDKGARWRWALESYKLWTLFPDLLATSNVFLVASLFELHLQMLLEAVREQEARAESAMRGLRHTLDELGRWGLPARKMVLWPAIDAFIRVRNCLMHASGVLGRSREGWRIQSIVDERSYLTPEHASRPSIQLMTLEASAAGVRLRVDNQYPWLAAAYARDFIIELCANRVPGRK